MDGAEASESSAAGTAPVAAVSSPETPHWCYQKLSLGEAGRFEEKGTPSSAKRVVHTIVNSRLTQECTLITYGHGHGQYTPIVGSQSSALVTDCDTEHTANIPDT